MLEQYLDWFEHLKLYQEYLSKLPEPFNHSILLSILFLCLMFTLVSTIVNHILSWRFYRRIKAKNRKLEEEKIDRKLQEAEEEKWKKSENELERNKSIELSEYGIENAKEFFDCIEFSGVDNVYCSDYVRSYKTGKLLNKNVVIDSRLGERISGIPDLSITPNEYFYKQVIDENYKFECGESKKEITERMYEALIDIIGSNIGKKVLIVSHGTSMTFLLMKLCDLKITDIKNKIRKITFND